MLKITRTGQSKAKKLLNKLIPEDAFMAQNPSAKDLALYKRIKQELEIGAKEGFISKIAFSSRSSKAKLKSDRTKK